MFDRVAGYINIGYSAFDDWYTVKLKNMKWM